MTGKKHSKRGSSAPNDLPPSPYGHTLHNLYFPFLKPASPPYQKGRSISIKHPLSCFIPSHNLNFSRYCYFLFIFLYCFIPYIPHYIVFLKILTIYCKYFMLLENKLLARSPVGWLYVKTRIKNLDLLS